MYILEPIAAGILKGVRTDAVSGESREVRIAYVIKRIPESEDPRFEIVCGGVTGYECWTLDLHGIRLAIENGEKPWGACAGTKGRWDRLVVFGVGEAVQSVLEPLGLVPPDLCRSLPPDDPPVPGKSSASSPPPPPDDEEDPPVPGKSSASSPPPPPDDDDDPPVPGKSSASAPPPPPDDDDDPPVPGMRYWAHPESCCVWRSSEEEGPGDGCVVELDYPDFLRMVAEWGESLPGELPE